MQGFIGKSSLERLTQDQAALCTGSTFSSTSHLWNACCTADRQYGAYLFDVNRTGGAGGLSSSSDMLYPLLCLCCQSILRCCVSIPSNRTHVSCQRAYISIFIHASSSHDFHFQLHVWDFLTKKYEISSWSLPMTTTATATARATTAATAATTATATTMMTTSLTNFQSRLYPRFCRKAHPVR